ncbi:pectate lyase [Saccharicrinis sp. FJH54]|uniref:pectate lyase n=1 Tax=Saccharicrinis sp. FJH54 TaxID=3344665 RepID=UPI0035D5204C
MMKKTTLLFLGILGISICSAEILLGQTKDTLNERIKETMYNATRFMVDSVSTNGGYLWNYLPDMSRRWGEMEAYPTMIWLQHPGTVSMGHIFMEAYHTTGNEYYYKAAEKAAAAIIWGQNPEGGWNYMVDFAGDKSLKYWYKTIGKNGWRLEEFQHYYGNSTFDDDVSSDAARFLLQLYLEKLDPKYKPSLDKAINFILESQYPAGGWPQRYPHKEDFIKQGFPDYTSYYTFNDDVTWENIHFLIQCYLTLGEERFLEPIRKGMDFYLQSQDSCGAWAQQLDMDMKPASARTFEPLAYLPSTTCENAFLLLRFYQYTGNRKFLNGVPKAISWLEATKLPEDKTEGERTHPTFVNVKTNAPVYVHRRGSNEKYGRYYTDENDKNLPSHYYGKSRVPLEQLKKEYSRIAKMPVSELLKDSPITPAPFMHEGTPQKYYNLNRFGYRFSPDKAQVIEIINALDDQHRWLIKHAMTSHPYIGDGKDQTETDEYATTFVGDETDTSPYRDPSDQEYISTSQYIRNMLTLINYLKKTKNEE